MQYRFGILNCAILIVVISSLMNKVKWRINKMYFSDDLFIREIVVTYGNTARCVLKVQSIEPHRNTDSMSAKCFSNHSFVAALTFAGISIISYIILIRFAFTLKENALKHVFTMLLLEVRLVSIIYGTFFLIIQILLKTVSFVLGFAQNGEELFLW